MSDRKPKLGLFPARQPTEQRLLTGVCNMKKLLFVQFLLLAASCANNVPNNGKVEIIGGNMFLYSMEKNMLNDTLVVLKNSGEKLFKQHWLDGLLKGMWIWKEKWIPVINHSYVDSSGNRFDYYSDEPGSFKIDPYDVYTDLFYSNHLKLDTDSIEEMGPTIVNVYNAPMEGVVLAIHEKGIKVQEMENGFVLIPEKPVSNAVKYSLWYKDFHKRKIDFFHKK
jgi:hypothetical protein